MVSAGQGFGCLVYLSSVSAYRTSLVLRPQRRLVYILTLLLSVGPSSHIGCEKTNSNQGRQLRSNRHLKAFAVSQSGTVVGQHVELPTQVFLVMEEN
jgi:hypothetical protein